MVKTEHCCCLFSVKTGTYILGVMLMLSCAAELGHPNINPFRWAVKIAAAGVFVFMYMRDNSFTRMLFFYTFIANGIALALVNSITDDSDNEHGDQLGKLDFDKIANQTCNDMKPEERENMGYATVKECSNGLRAEMYRTIIGVGFIFLIAIVALQVHFCMVLYQHWQNSTLSPEDGGTMEDSAHVQD